MARLNLASSVVGGLWPACLFASSCLGACVRQAPPRHIEREKTPVMPPLELASPAPSPDLRKAAPGEVAHAMARAFGSGLPTTAYDGGAALVGDFNADGSSDLAVPTRVVAPLMPDPTTGLANWILQDPEAVLSLEPHPSPTPLPFALGDAALVVIHGFGPAGWRSPEARQAYLLKLPVETRFVVRPGAALGAEPGGLGPLVQRSRGHVLVTRDGRRFLHWTGGRYAWHGAPGAGVRRE